MAGLRSWLAKQIAKPLAYAAERFNLPFLNRFAASHGDDFEHMTEELARAEKSMVKYPTSGGPAPAGAAGPAHRVEPQISPPEIGQAGPRPAASQPTTTAKALSITSNEEAFAAAQEIKALAKIAQHDPKQGAELIRQTLAIFGSKSGAPYVTEVTKTLAHALGDSKSPAVAHSLQRLVGSGREIIESRMVQRSEKMAHLGNTLERDVLMNERKSLNNANISDARTLLETGATGPQRNFALGTIMRNAGTINAEESAQVAAATLARTAKTPELLKELAQFASSRNEGAHLFTPDAIATIAKANNAAFAKDESWRSMLTNALDTQFGNQAREQLKWITSNASGLPGSAVGNDLINRSIALSAHVPIDPSRPTHDALVTIAKNLHLSPATEENLTKFWLETNAKLRMGGHTQQANQSVAHAMTNTPNNAQLASRAEAEIRIAQHFSPVPPPTQSFNAPAQATPTTPRQAPDVAPAAAATTTRPTFHRDLDGDPIVVPPAMSEGGKIPAFHFTDSRTPGASPKLPAHAQNDDRILTTDNMHDVTRRAGRPVTHLRAE